MLRRGGHRLGQAHFPTPDCALLRVKIFAAPEHPSSFGRTSLHITWDTLKCIYLRHQEGTCPG